MNHQVWGGGYPDLSGSTTKKKHFFYVRLTLSAMISIYLRFVY